MTTTTSKNNNSILVQLTDLHIREPGRLAYGRIDTAPYLARAVQSVLALRQAPDAVVVTGDLNTSTWPACWRRWPCRST
jgi:Icc protein